MENFILGSLNGSNSLTDFQQFYQQVKEPLFHLKDIGLPQRVVMHWDKYGLLSLNRDNNDQWRKFNFIDYTWLSIIQDLRSLGVPLEMIKKIKDSILSQITQQDIINELIKRIDEIEQMENEQLKNDIKVAIGLFDPTQTDVSQDVYILSIAIAHALGGKRNVYLIIFKDGSCLFPYDEAMKADYSEETQQKLIFETHITVSISNIIRTFLASEKSSSVLPKLDMLSEQKMQILDIISSGDYTEVSVSFFDKKINYLSLTKEHDPKRLIVDILLENEFQDIVVKRRNGVIVKITGTERIKMNDW